LTKKLLGSLELNRIYQRDCLEGMAAIPDKNVDLIVIDPPYNIGIKGAEWDKYGKEEYAEFMSNVFRECERVLKDNGSFYWFHNEMPQIAKLMTWLDDNTHFIFNSFITWDKGDWRALSWKNPSERSNLRCWFNTSEYCLFYTFQDDAGLKIAFNHEKFNAIGKYFKDEREKSGLTKTKCDEIMGVKSSYYIWENTKIDDHHTVRIPRQELYEKLQLTGFWQKPYEELRREYNELRSEFENDRYTHNLDENHNNLWRYKTENTGKYHACQKPLTVIERIIKTSSNENDVVLDCFMGSGTTALAAARLGRNFIGFERESEYVRIANQRLEAIQDDLAEQKLTE
jgi:DNA modification methylase